MLLKPQVPLPWLRPLQKLEFRLFGGEIGCPDTDGRR